MNRIKFIQSLMASITIIILWWLRFKVNWNLKLCENFKHSCSVEKKRIETNDSLTTLSNSLIPLANFANKFEAQKCTTGSGFTGSTGKQNFSISFSIDKPKQFYSSSETEAGTWQFNNFKGRGQGRGPYNGGIRHLCQICGKIGHLAGKCWYWFDQNFTP